MPTPHPSLAVLRPQAGGSFFLIVTFVFFLLFAHSHGGRQLGSSILQLEGKAHHKLHVYYFCCTLLDFVNMLKMSDETKLFRSFQEFWDFYLNLLPLSVSVD